MQPIYVDAMGTKRFSMNRIVRFLLDHGPYDINDLAAMPFSNADLRQFAQLIGYSVSGYSELSYGGCKEEVLSTKILDDNVSHLEAENAELKRKLAAVTDSARVMMTELFRIHADDLQA
jgi:hypothetical protein